MEAVGFSSVAVAKIEERDLSRCARCGRFIAEGGNKHHRKFRSRGGKGNIANGVLLCGSGTTGCHGWAHHNIADATAEGFIVSSWEEATLVAVHTWRGWMLLADDGTWEHAIDRDGTPVARSGPPEGSSAPETS